MRYLAKLDGDVRGPFAVLELLALPGFAPDTQVCPEFEVVGWREARAVPELAFLMRVRESSRRLLADNRALREGLKGAVRARRELAARLESALIKLAGLRNRAEFADAARLQDVQDEAADLRLRLGEQRAELSELAAALERLRARYAAAQAELARLKAIPPESETGLGESLPQ
ncbi:MAG TPA: hypothetical protein VNI01_14870 [Elusimicrobiota bacterium]|nr:hypothetical protein [Elusimicrobiota bacterium]